MKPQSRDTHPEIERIRIEWLRKAGPHRRLQLGLALCNEAFAIAQQGIRRAHPEASELEAKLIFVEVTYGKDLADRVREYLATRQRES
ncbi:MAG TPA: hypothetical protein VKT25_09090 [Ktedonobacteraceae bacterium]|nr:hypothetical protein [Ktedonobacteraceae bacterium]